MKVYRYMSFEEFSRLTSGCILKNDNHFHRALSGSIGFCFLGEETKVEGINGTYEFDTIDAYNFLQGIVSSDILVELEVSSQELQEAEGIYADPTTDDWYARVAITEYSTMEYDRDRFQPLRYTVDVGVRNRKKITWYDLHL